MALPCVDAALNRVGFVIICVFEYQWDFLAMTVFACQVFRAVHVHGHFEKWLEHSEAKRLGDRRSRRPGLHTKFGERSMVMFCGAGTNGGRDGRR